MYNDKDRKKHYLSAHRRKMLKQKRRQRSVLAISLFLCCIICGVTLAYVFTHTDPIKNTFVPTQVSCEVLEGEDGDTFNGTIKENVRIQNTGKTASYIRAAVVVTWASNDSTKVTATKPVDDKDYVITYADEHADANSTTTNWEKGSDGFWYYKVPVEIGNVTENLIWSCSLIKGVTAPDGYYLSVEIVASAIQSTPTSVVTAQWQSGVSGVSDTDKTTLVIK